MPAPSHSWPEPLVLRMARRDKVQRVPYWPHILQAEGLEDVIEEQRRRAALTVASGVLAFAAVLYLWWVVLEPLWRVGSE